MNFNSLLSYTLGEGQNYLCHFMIAKLEITRNWYLPTNASDKLAGKHTFSQKKGVELSLQVLYDQDSLALIKLLPDLSE